MPVTVVSLWTDVEPARRRSMQATRYDVYCRFYCCVFCNQPIQTTREGGGGVAATMQGWIASVGQHNNDLRRVGKVFFLILWYY